MCPNPQETADLVTVTEEILYGKIIFCVVILFHIRTFYYILGRPVSYLDVLFPIWTSY